MTLKWRDGTRINNTNVDSEAALVELERIRKYHDGKLKPEDVVEESTPKEAVLHPLFEWRNAVAANQYRLWQARQIIKDVRIEVVHADRKVENPYYVAVRVENAEGKKENYYQAAEIAVTRPDEWLSAVSSAQSKISQARNSLEELERIARGTDDSDRLARLAIAAKALDTAAEALRH